MENLSTVSATHAYIFSYIVYKCVHEHTHKHVEWKAYISQGVSQREHQKV